MDRKTAASQAIILRGYCDLTGKPCLPGINLLQSMMHATQSIGEALPDDFRFEAEVEITVCPRACSLSLRAESRAVEISRNTVLLAEAGDAEPRHGALRISELTACVPALSRRAH